MTLNRVSGSESAPAISIATSIISSTTEKVRQFLSRIKSRGTLFSILAGGAITALRGVKFGLLSAGIGTSVTWAIASFKASKTQTSHLKPEKTPFNRFQFPFDTLDLRTILAVDYPEIDETEILLHKLQRATFIHDYRPGPPGLVVYTEKCNGYRITLQMPPSTVKNGQQVGLVSYFITNREGCVAPMTDVREITLFQ